MLGIVGLLGTTCGCTPMPLIKTGAPVVVQISEKDNPNVIWVTRTVDLPPKTGPNYTPTTYFGLFACYRSVTPGFPECYLAKVIGENKSLVWPESPKSFAFPYVSDKDSLPQK